MHVHVHSNLHHAMYHGSICVFVSAELKKIQLATKQGAQANISPTPRALGSLIAPPSGGYQQSLGPHGGLGKVGSLKRGSNYSMSHSVKF